ncbi:unnamed protein product [Paramecium sonneborni]|uniref:Tetratricopeptide repeat protein n=1 Tax=Paramecium sonneborni TaxID=65129 RepID=A0A8S1LE56_9CILI|nr:unnamed protein product [Paramecium sonneborni]
MKLQSIIHHQKDAKSVEIKVVSENQNQCDFYEVQRICNEDLTLCSYKITKKLLNIMIKLFQLILNMKKPGTTRVQHYIPSLCLRVLSRLQKYQEAIECWNEAIQINLKDDKTWHNNIFILQKKYIQSNNKIQILLIQKYKQFQIFLNIYSKYFIYSFFLLK